MQLNGLSVPTGRRVHALIIAAGLFMTFAYFYSTDSLPSSLPSLPVSISGSRPSSSNSAAVELEGLKIGEPFDKYQTHSNTEDRLEWLKFALMERFTDTGGVVPYPSCTYNPKRFRSTVGSPLYRYNTKQRVSIAINLSDSAAIVPALSIALLQAITYLLPSNKVYVSIFENNSKDATVPLLSDLAAALEALGIDGLWVQSSRLKSDFDNQDRINMLSEIRNHALQPLMPYAGDGTLLFMNDVITCASDILELVHQQRLQRAHAVMGMDWETVAIPTMDWETVSMNGATPELIKPRLYDTWVSRGINGDLVYPFFSSSGYTPFSPNNDWVQDAYMTQDNAIYERWLDGRPIPVYSGWGGAVAFDASLFTKKRLRFRSSKASSWDGGSRTGSMGAWGELISKPGYLESDCLGASECEYINRDIWNLFSGKARIMMTPQVRMAYRIADWTVMEGFQPIRREDFDNRRDLIDWNNVTIPHSVVCVGTRTDEGEKLHPWDSTNVRFRLDPLFHSNSTIT